MSEWDSIYISSNERMSLTNNWTNVFTAKFQDLNNMCVLKFIFAFCSAHIMNKISYNLKKFIIDKRLKRIIMHVFGSMVNCGHMNGINELCILLCYLVK